MDREGRRNPLDRRWKRLGWRAWLLNRRRGERRTGFDRRARLAPAY